MTAYVGHQQGPSHWELHCDHSSVKLGLMDKTVRIGRRIDIAGTWGQVNLALAPRYDLILTMLMWAERVASEAGSCCQSLREGIPWLRKALPEQGSRWRVSLKKQTPPTRQAEPILGQQAYQGPLPPCQLLGSCFSLGTLKGCLEDIFLPNRHTLLTHREDSNFCLQATQNNSAPVTAKTVHQQPRVMRKGEKPRANCATKKKELQRQDFLELELLLWSWLPDKLKPLVKATCSQKGEMIAESTALGTREEDADCG
ncbi:uncharacterized protein LOC115939937 [Leptonychotes weddellii]|uniref:Uncharacterized protein LOC115939937 n=1 Tax=Leptonychotes weddellii TaxID=9713 RepID=A0A7F8QHW1_LEPWE|nr:uncharacterized protein LOC115939937 [Leptonychotes weddellii]